MVAKKTIPDSVACVLLERFQTGSVILELSSNDFGPAIVKRTLISLLGKDLYTVIAHRNGQFRLQTAARKANLGNSYNVGRKASEKAKRSMRIASRKRLISQGYDVDGKQLELERRRKIRAGQLVVGPKRSQTEQCIYHSLVQRFPDAVHSYKVFYEKDDKKRRIVFDILIPSENTIVEVNGDYWHYNPTMYQWNYWDEYRKTFAYQIWQRDLNRHLVAIERGFKIKVLWQKDFVGKSVNDFAQIIENSFQNQEFDV